MKEWASAASVAYTTTGGVDGVFYVLNDGINLYIAAITSDFEIIPGDINGDLKVRVDDILAVALAFSIGAGDPDHDSNLDVNCDDKIRVDDILIAALNFGLG